MSYKMKYVKPNTSRKTRSGRVRQDFAGEEPLTGIVQDKPASDIEERFYRACNHNRIRTSFQEEIKVATSLPGQYKQVDFVLKGKQYVNVHGKIGHSAGTDKTRDKIRDALINEALTNNGYPPIQTVWYYELGSQKQADEIVRRRFA